VSGNEAPVTWFREFGGVCIGGDPEQIPFNAFSDALNFELSAGGQLAPRQGFNKFTASAVPDGSRVVSMASLDWDGDRKLLVASQKRIYFYNTTLDTWTQIYPATDVDYSGSGRPTFALLDGNAAPFVIIGNGTFPLQKWAGTGACSAVSGDAGLPSAGRVMAFKNYLVVWDIPNYPGVVQFAINPGDEATWLVGGVERYIDMHGTVTSCVDFNGLVVFTANRAELFSGDPDAPGGMVTLSATIGCAVHETAVDCAGVLVWLSHGGVMAWDGSGKFPTACVSDPDDPGATRVQRLLEQTYWTGIGSASAAFHPRKKQYFLTFEYQGVAAGPKTWKTLVLHFGKSVAWHPWDLEATCYTVTIGPKSTELLLAGATTGWVRREESGDFTDYGGALGDVSFDYFLKTGDWDGGDPNSQKLWRAVYISTSGIVGDVATGSRAIVLAARGEFDRSGGDEYSMDIAAGGFVLGFGTLPGVLLDNPRFIVKRAPIALRSKRFNLTIAGTGKENALSISAIGIEAFPIGPRKILVATAGL